MKVTVTAEDIEQGVRSHPSACPLALALRRRTGEVVRINDLGDVWRGGRMSYQLFPPAWRFLRNFDAGKPVKAATFMLLELEIE